jgi:hypothetical protein
MDTMRDARERERERGRVREREEAPPGNIPLVHKDLVPVLSNC